MQLKLFQSEVAKIFDVCADSVTGWENGKSKPLTRHYPRIIQFLGYNPFQIDETTLGGRIKKYRMENGLSQEGLAKMLGVDESSVWSWEADKHKPLPSKMKLLEKILHQKELSK